MQGRVTTGVTQQGTGWQKGSDGAAVTALSGDTCACHTTLYFNKYKRGSWGADFSGLVYSGIGYRALVKEESTWKKLKSSHRKMFNDPVLL